MPKNLTIHPSEVRGSGVLEIQPIPINQYNRSLEDEVRLRGKDTLIRILRDMRTIRGFESMLNEVKLKGNYHGVEFSYRGPAHLSIGQEASAVGQAFSLKVEDHIFGSHRSHGEIIAKGLSAIEQLNDDSLMEIMRNYLGGDALRVVDDGTHESVKDLATEYLLYGALAEIFAKSTGLNRGMGGSMHTFFTPFGVYPNNAIVGGSADISVGAALYKLVNRQPGIVVCNIGDASAGCGPVWEALCFATMDQFKELWDEAHRGGLPLIMNFVNNFYGMGGQPVGETMGFKVLARMGAGLNPDNMHAERVDGYNPLAVLDAYERKKQIIARSDGPVLLDTLTYRFSGHSPSDASTYRDKSEIEAWQNVDSLITFHQSLVDGNVAETSTLDAQAEKIDALVMKIYKKAIDMDLSPRVSLHLPGTLLEETMFSNETVESFAPERKPEVAPNLEENSRVKALATRSRYGYDEEGKPLSKAKCYVVRDAIFEAVLDRFQKDATLVAYGEENRDWGGAFAAYRGLTEALPYHRLFNSSISEGAIVGTAVGYALEGGRALVELMYCDFMGRAGDEIFNQLAKWQSMSAGVLKMPVVLRVSVGSKYGAQHSQDWTAITAHIPGLKVVFPVTPYDTRGLLASALSGTDPVVFFESQRMYDMPELFHKEGVPTEYYEIPIGEPDVKRVGSDLTILTIGATLYRAMDAAKILQEQYGVSAEIIDARSLVPFQYEKVIESIKKTRRIVLASDACERGSYMHTVAQKITQFAFDELDAPPVVVGARNWITPPDELEDSFFPFPSEILDAIHLHIKPLPGYTVSRPFSNEELMRRSALGI